MVENNHFDNPNDAHFFHEGSTTAPIIASGNASANTAGKRDVGQGSAFAKAPGLAEERFLSSPVPSAIQFKGTSTFDWHRLVRLLQRSSATT